LFLAAAHRLDSQLTMTQSVKLLLNRDFILLLLCFGINIGVFYAISTVIAAALEPFGFSPVRHKLAKAFRSLIRALYDFRLRVELLAF